MTKVTKDSFPAPGDYPHWQPMRCVPKFKKSVMTGNGKGEKICAFIEDAKYHG